MALLHPASLGTAARCRAGRSHPGERLLTRRAVLPARSLPAPFRVRTYRAGTAASRAPVGQPVSSRYGRPIWCARPRPAQMPFCVLEPGARSRRYQADERRSAQILASPSPRIAASVSRAAAEPPPPRRKSARCRARNSRSTASMTCTRPRPVRGTAVSTQWREPVPSGIFRDPGSDRGHLHGGELRAGRGDRRGNLAAARAGGTRPPR